MRVKNIELDEVQQGHFDAVMQLYEEGEGGWCFLNGGPGSGKTCTTSEIQLEMMEKYKIDMISIYPTHAARLVGIQQLNEASYDEDGRPTVTVRKYEGEDVPNENSDVILEYCGGRITFKTIDAALGVRMVQHPGRDAKFEQSFTNAVKSQTNFLYKAIFIDEVSMISEEKLLEAPMGADDKRPIKAGVVYMLEQLEKRVPDFRPFVHFTGDFDQLRPITGMFARPIFEDRDNFDVMTFLTKNHRSGREGICALIKEILRIGRLPANLEQYNNVYPMNDVERYEKKFIQTVQVSGGDVLGLSFSNPTRIRHSDLAAQAYEQSTQFFVGNTLTAAEGKSEKIFPPPNHGPQFEIYLYNSEKVKISEYLGEMVVPDTAYAGPWSVKAHAVVLKRLMTPAYYHQFYLLDYLGDKKPDCPKFKYLSKVKSTLNNHLKTLVSRDRREKTLKEIEKIKFADDLIDYLGEKDDFLGHMLSTLCYDQGLQKNIEEYLRDIWWIDGQDSWITLFDRVPAGTPCSIFNLMWAVLYGRVDFQLLTTRSENAMTCHSAQGSGRDIVFLNTRDIKRIDPDTKKRLLYVAVSRAKKELTILR